MRTIVILAAGMAVAAATQDGKKQPLPEPEVVSPGVTGTPDAPGKPPSDAIVLFDGKSLDNWETGKGEPAKWELVEGGAMRVVRKGGTIRTKQKLGYGQYHVEFRTPAEVKGSGQGRGNSGVFPMGGNEVQVLDSYGNKTYPDGQCSAVYKQWVPLVNACRPPGTWQTYDIIYHKPQVDADGRVVRQGAYTVLHNGILTLDNVEVKQKDPKATGSLVLQDHGNPVEYRNIWYRPWREQVPGN